MADKEFDVAIIGSGAGGGTVAARLAPLAKKGLRIAVLERGPRLKDSEFSGKEIEMAEKLYADGGGFLTKNRQVSLAFARGYGGSTIVYTGTSIKIAKRTLESWAVPGLDWDDLSRRTDRCADENGAKKLEPELINDNNRLFKEACEKLGWPAEQFPINVRGCKGSGLCNLGCPNGAKQGTNRVQLPAAEAAGVEVVTGCRVEKISENALEVVVEPQALGEPSRWKPGRYSIKAKTIVCSAGAVDTPALLLRSGLGKNLPELGRWFTIHPALILAGRRPMPISNSVGHPKSYYCEHFAESKRFLLETCMYFPFTTAKNISGFGPEHEAFISALDRLQMILVLALDPARRDNRVTIDSAGNPVVDYTLFPDVLDSLHAAMESAAEIFFESGCDAVHAPASDEFLIPASRRGELKSLIRRENMLPGKISISAAHLMGGCRMGHDASDSVADSWGRVHGFPWLRVADASLFPKAAEINPYLTVMALADRVAEKIAEEHGARP